MFHILKNKTILASSALALTIAYSPFSYADNSAINDGANQIRERQSILSSKTRKKILSDAFDAIRKTEKVLKAENGLSNNEVSVLLRRASQNIDFLLTHESMLSPSQAFFDDSFFPHSLNNNNHFREITQMHQRMDKIFDNEFRELGFPNLGVNDGLFKGGRNEGLKSNGGITAYDKKYEITVEMPDVPEENINIEFQNNMLIVKGEKKQESEKKDKNSYRVERSYGAFQRAFSLPNDADKDNINRQFKDGILTIIVPKKL